MSSQRRVPLGQKAVIFAARVLANVELYEDEPIKNKERLADRIIELAHELPLCVKEEEDSEAR